MENILKKILKSIKFNDTGVKRNVDSVISPNSSSKNKKYYPTTYFNTEQIPGMEGLEVGDSCMFILRGKVVGHSLNEHEKRKNEEYQIEIKSAAVVSDNK